MNWVTDQKWRLVLKINGILETLGLKEESRLEASKMDYDYKSGLGFNGDGKYAIYVYGSEGDSQPHFHIVDQFTRGKRFNMEVRLKDLTITSLLDKKKHIKKSGQGITWEGYSDIRKHLIAFLNTPYVNKKTGVKLKTRYLFIVQHWDDNNPENQINVSDMLTKIE